MAAARRRAQSAGTQRHALSAWAKAVFDDREKNELEPHTRCKPSGVLRQFLTPEGTKFQYTHGAPADRTIAPESYALDSALLARPGNDEIQLDLFLDYASNVKLYPQFQAYFRKHQPPTLVVWGKNDPIFPPAGAEPYKRDLKNLEFHLLDTGHFALEEDGDLIAGLMRNFLRNSVKR